MYPLERTGSSMTFTCFQREASILLELERLVPKKILTSALLVENGVKHKFF